MKAYGHMAEHAARLLLRHGKPALSPEAVEKLFRDVDRCARSEEATAIVDVLTAAGHLAAAKLVLTREQERMVDQTSEQP